MSGHNIFKYFNYNQPDCFIHSGVWPNLHCLLSNLESIYPIFIFLGQNVYEHNILAMFYDKPVICSYGPLQSSPN